jgi:hypothetical protein
VLFQEMNFGPYTGYQLSRPNLEYQTWKCPNCEEICYRQGVWFEQRMMLGTQADMDEIVTAFQKVYDNRAALAEG